MLKSVFSYTGCVVKFIRFTYSANLLNLRICISKPGSHHTAYCYLYAVRNLDMICTDVHCGFFFQSHTVPVQCPDQPALRCCNAVPVGNPYSS